jgi:hypothetical protein
MTTNRKLALLTVTVVLGATPAVALAAGPPSGSATPPSNQGTAHQPSDPGTQGTAHKPADRGGQGTAHKPSTPGPKASLPAKAKAYGKYCQGESKKHVAGQHGTPFSRCVTDMAKLAKGQVKGPRNACKDESKKHVAGQHGTPFSLCVSGGAKLKKDQSSSD